MKQKLIIIMVSCFVLATGLVVTLYAVSDKMIHEPGSFLRVYQKGFAVKSNEMDMGINSWYIAGIDDEHVYLGNLTQPLHMLVTNLSLTDSQRVKIELKDLGDGPVYQKSVIRIYPPYFYYVDGVSPGLHRGKLGEWVAERFMYDSAFFDQSEIIGPSSLAFRTRNLQLENVLGKQFNLEPKIKLAPDLLQKQIDGIFCTDGMLRYNKDMKRLIYTYYYRNEYIVYDTNLNLDFRGHTIDTFTHAQIKTAYVQSTKTHLVTSRKFTNKESSTAGNYLFIASNLLAKNDFPKIFEMMSVIDVYDLRNNTYKFSFTLPNDNPESKLREFRMYDNKFLLGIYDHYLVKFDLQSARYLQDDLP